MKSPKKHGTLSNTFFALSWYFKISPAYTLYRILSHIIGNIITLFEHTFLAAYIIDCIEKGKPLKNILYFLIPVAVAVTLKITINPIIGEYFGPKFDARFKKEVHLKLYKKAAELEIAKYDNAEFYNDFVWAMREAPSHINDIVNTLCTLLSNIAIALIAGTYIMTSDFVAIIAAAVIVPICFFTHRITNKLYVKREEELVPLRRKRDYVNRVFYIIDFIKDIKTSKISDKLQRDFKESSIEQEKPIKKYGFKICGLNIFRNSLWMLAWDGVYLTYLFYQAIIKSKFGLGTLLGLYNSGDRLTGNLNQITRILPDFQKHGLYVDKLRTFLETENEMPDNGSKDLPENGDIRLRDVYFTYPGNYKPTINGINLDIKKGEKIALVGFNGAGKSTLIKLILRLYDPTGGSISYGERNICEYPLKGYREKYGVLFQDFEIIAVSIAENINMGSGEFDRQKADPIIEKVGFTEKLSTLADGYQTELTKEFSEKGVNLSGGEAQKLALARVLYSSADIIILDEPSSALDPIAEYQLNKAVTELNREKTVIIISHRLSTTRFVDKIHMLENGKIIESGKHEELLKMGGKYAEMFRLQAEKYNLH